MRSILQLFVVGLDFLFMLAHDSTGGGKRRRGFDVKSNRSIDPKKGAGNGNIMRRSSGNSATKQAISCCSIAASHSVRSILRLHCVCTASASASLETLSRAVRPVGWPVADSCPPQRQPPPGVLVLLLFFVMRGTFDWIRKARRSAV